MNFLKYFAAFTSGSLSYFIIKSTYNNFSSEDLSNSSNRKIKSGLLNKIINDDNSIELK